MTDVCIIPARGGSRRIPRKNIKPFYGRPMLTYAIETARRSRLFDDVAVSTEDEEIAEIARHAGASWIKRDNNLWEDDVGTQHVMQAALQTYGDTAIDYACCLYPCTPLVTPRDLQEASAMFVDREKQSYVIAIDQSGHDIGGFYFGRANLFLSGWPLWNNETRVHVLPPQRACDINTLDDWERAERLYAEMQRNTL